MATDIEIVPLTRHIGAEIRGVDVRDLDDEGFARVHEALMDHLVIFFRDQDISDDEHIAFASRFGAPINRLGFSMYPGEMAGLLALVGPAVVLEILLEGRILSEWASKLQSDDLARTERQRYWRAKAMREQSLNPEFLGSKLSGCVAIDILNVPSDHPADQYGGGNAFQALEGLN